MKLSIKISFKHNIINIYIYIYIYIYINLFYSQVEPSPNNAAANSLAKDIQTRNVRKVEVNAQVTFVVWILECVANFCIFIPWIFLSGLTRFGTLTLSMSWYYLILQHTYLMNTSHNKDRITDDGWKNTIRNAIRLPFNLKMDCFQGSLQNVEEGQPATTQPSSKIRQRQEMNYADQRSTSETRAVGLPANYKRDSRQIVHAEVYVISNSENTIQPSAHDYIYLPNVPDGQPSTSKGISKSRHRQKPVDFAQRPTSETDSDNVSLQQSYRFYIGEKILSNMMNNMNNEEQYLHYFRQLIQFEETLKHEDACLKDFEIVHITDFQASKEGRVKRSNSQPRARSVSDKDKPIHLSKSKSTLPQHIAVQTDFIGRFSDRIDMRRNILENLHLYCSDEELYDIFLNRLLNFEESVIRN